MNIQKSPKLGIIGAGSIVRSHIDAAYKAGFTPKSICGKNYSIRAQKLSEEFSDIDYCETIDALLETDIDALLIAVTPSESLTVLATALTRDVPILIEKPASVSASAIRDFSLHNSSRVLVGFNRRHYSSVSTLKQRISGLESGLVQVDLPELSWRTDTDQQMRKQMLLENSVHMFDLVNYIFGLIEPLNITKVSDAFGTRYAALSFKSSGGFIGNINLSYGTPENFSLKVWSDKLNLELKPLEIYTEFNHIEGIPASIDLPFKRYVKQSEKSWEMSSNDKIAKPGFIQQYEDLLSLVLGDGNKLISAKLDDAEKALQLAEMLM